MSEEPQRRKIGNQPPGSAETGVEELTPLSARRRPRSKKRGQSSSQLASWVFGLLIVLFLMALVIFPWPIPLFKQRIVGFLCAILAGFLGYFFDGSLSIRGTTPAPRDNGPETQRVTVRATKSLAAFVLVFGASWFNQSPHDLTNSVSLRVLILAPDGVVVDKARAWTSVGGEPKQVSGGWQFDIPVDALPEDGAVTVYATYDAAFLSGSVQTKLSEEHPRSSVELHLIPRSSTNVAGVILDSQGNGLEGAKVSVIGHEREAVLTGSGGSFELPAHAPNGQQIQLRAEKPGYSPTTQYHPAGSSVTLTLDSSY